MSASLNPVRVLALLEEAEASGLTGELVFQFQKGELMRWKRTEGGGPKDLPQPPLLTKEPG